MIRKLKLISKRNVSRKKAVGTNLQVRGLSTSPQRRKDFYNFADYTALDIAPKGYWTPLMPNVSEDTIKPQQIDQGLNIRYVRPGDRLYSPHELTITQGTMDLWHSSFYCNERLNTSMPFAKRLDFSQPILPFSLMLFLAGAMSHVDAARVQVAFRNAYYYHAVMPGDILAKRFLIRSLRNVNCTRFDKDTPQQQSIVTIHCELLQHNTSKAVFACDKLMLFPFELPKSDLEIESPNENLQSTLLNTIINNSTELQQYGSQSLTKFEIGKLFVHSMTRQFSITQLQTLCNLGKLTHEKHFNLQKYKSNELLIPGSLIVSLINSLISRDFSEILYEELIHCNFLNIFSPQENLIVLSFVINIEEHVNGTIECLTVRNIAVKNVSYETILSHSFPFELCLKSLFLLMPNEIETFLCTNDIKYSYLCQNIVCMMDKKIYRQMPKYTPFLL